jgi:monofunctional glycosyltransferase
MGKGIFGVEAAAQYYFGKEASKLTRGEAAQIAAALPNPVRFTIKPLSKYVATRAQHLQGQMSNLDGDKDIEELIK